MKLLLKIRQLEITLRKFELNLDAISTDGGMWMNWRYVWKLNTNSVFDLFVYYGSCYFVSFSDNFVLN